MHLARHFPVVAAFSLLGITAGCGGGGTEPRVGPPAAITAVGGATAAVIAGTTTPIPLVAKVVDASGTAVSGVSVSWGTQSGSVSPATGTTDAIGQTTAQWTPGTTAGSQVATASLTGVGSASFQVTVSAGALARLKLTTDTVKLTGAGSTFVVLVSGSDAFGNFVAATGAAYAIDDPGFATVDQSGKVTAVATGTTTLRVMQGSVSATAVVIVNTAVVNPCAGVTISLAVGEARTLTGTSANQICLTGAAGAEFVAVPFYGTGNGGSGSGQRVFTAAPTLAFTLNPLTNTTVSGPPTPNVGAGSRLRASMGVDGQRGLLRDVAWEAKFRERARKQLNPLLAQARATRSSGSSLRKSLGISTAVVNVGDKLQLNVDVDSSCSNPQFVPATVKTVSAHAIVAEDDRDPANGFTDADYQSIASQFDLQVWPVDTDNFGVPSDIDNNGRVIIFFTRAVNELTPAGNTTSFVGGFFFGRDIIAKTVSCGSGTTFVGSNEAEMFYMLAPDPTGIVNNHVRSTAFVKSITIGTVAHEFQHLINFSRHYTNLNPTPFTAFEDAFLDEGLSHVAEELNYYAATARSPRANIDANTFVNPSDAYLAFGNQNAVRFREYLKNPDKYPPYSVLADTSLAVRGAIWSFLRYATDQRASVVPEKTTWFQLVNPTKDVEGVNNLKEVYGSDLLAKFRDWAVANYLDDSGVSTGIAAYTHPSWNTRSVETYVNGPNQANGTVFPLKVGTMLSAPVNLSLADGGAAYIRFGVASGAVGGATIASSGALPSTFSITVVRTK